jgi:D-psicose/D-tagatose/L-ribulose 3-epimerase
MKLGISTFVWYSPFGTENFGIIPKVKNIGYDIFEIAVEDAGIVDWDLLKKICDDNGLEITLSGAFGPDRDISHEDPAIRKNGIQYITECIQLCGRVNSIKFGGPMYASVGKARPISDEEKKRERSICVENLKIVSKIAQDNGVTLGLEALNRFENDMINTVDQAIDLIEEVNSPNLKLLLDTFHANIEEKNIPEAIRKAGSLLCHIHGNENDRGTPGSGHTDWPGIKQALSETGYNQAIVIETFGTVSKEIARAASIWIPLAKSADILANDGYQFFNTLFR